MARKSGVDGTTTRKRPFTIDVVYTNIWSIDQSTHPYGGLWSIVSRRFARDGAGVVHYIHRLPHIHTSFPSLRALVKGLKYAISFFSKIFCISCAVYTREFGYAGNVSYICKVNEGRAQCLIK
jgi:hypothetical protein